MKSKFSLLLVTSAILFSLVGCNEKIAPEEPEKVEPEKPEVVEPSFDKTKINLTQKELRGVWFTTVWNIDWPGSTTNVASQKSEMINYFNLFQKTGINAIFFQVKSMGDAFYESKYEPWSRFLTGVKGKNPGWDPIRFALDEAHKRGMQLHVWMNPYRIETRSDASAKFSPLDSRIPKEIVKDYATIRMYNPALPEARQRLADIVTDILTKYKDIDGVHFDDYFYPAPDQCKNKYDDDAEFEKYKKPGQNIKAWRTDNVNEMVHLIRETINKIDKNIIFTISPSGNMEYNSNSMYADVGRWCRERWIDAVIPQLYWGHKYFDPRLKQFCGLAGKTPVIVGYGTYCFEPNPPSYNWEFAHASLFEEEYKLAAAEKQVAGSMHYNASALRNNKVGITNKIRDIYSKNPRLMPYLGQNEKKPACPTNVQMKFGKLMWEGEGVQFAVYKDNASGRRRGKAASLLGVTTEKEFKLPGKGTFYVTAIDKYNNESLVSDMFEVK